MPPADSPLMRSLGYAMEGGQPVRARRPVRMAMSGGYSLFVGLLKVALPAFAATLILLLLAWPQLTLTRSGLGLDLAELALQEPDSLTMLNARFNGYDKKNRPFLVTADVASQAVEDENLITLELPKADMTLEDGAWIALTAKEGRYHRDVELVELVGQVSFYHDRGFELHTEKAEFDLRSGTAMGRDPVQGQGYFGDVEASGFDLFDHGERIVFLGPSRLLVLSGAEIDLSARPKP